MDQPGPEKAPTDYAAQHDRAVEEVFGAAKKIYDERRRATKAHLYNELMEEDRAALHARKR